MKSHEELFDDLTGMADWSAGIGDCGEISERMLAARWDYPRSQVRRFLANAEAHGLIRRFVRTTGTRLNLLSDKWIFDSGSLPRSREIPIKSADYIAQTVVAAFHHAPMASLKAMIGGRRGRGRPSRKASQQIMVNLWLYLLNTSAGFSDRKAHV